MSNINLTIRPGMPAADWTSQNPELLQFEMGVESDTLKCKVNWAPTPVHWNSLSYHPGGFLTNTSGDALLAGGVTVDCTVGTKQALYTVPAGKKCIITKAILRTVSASLAGITDDLLYGFDAGAADTGSFAGTAMQGLTSATKFLRSNTDTALQVSPVGNAGDVLGCRFNDASITATATIDVFGYLY
jgi:hypothetical protein